MVSYKLALIAGAVLLLGLLGYVVAAHAPYAIRQYTGYHSMWRNIRAMPVHPVTPLHYHQPIQHPCAPQPPAAPVKSVAWHLGRARWSWHPQPHTPGAMRPAPAAPAPQWCPGCPNTTLAPMSLEQRLWVLYGRLIMLKTLAPMLPGLPRDYIELINQAVDAYNQAVSAYQSGDYATTLAALKSAEALARQAYKLIHHWMLANGVRVAPPLIT